MANEEGLPLGEATPTTPKTTPPAATPNQPTAPTQKIAFEVNVPQQETLVTCEVCGHQNPQKAGMCALCSNYLFH